MVTNNRGLVAVEPRAFFRRLFRDLDPWFGGTEVPFLAPPRILEGFTWLPDVEVFERDHQLLVRVDLPGLKKEEVTVTVTGEELTIEGERTLETDKTEKEWYRTERAYGRFRRIVPLPEGIKPEEVKATFANGVLEVRAPLPAVAAKATAHKVAIDFGEKKEVKPAA
jgi:HSP20 family protein